VKICVITGSAGLIGAEAVRFFSSQGFRVVGIDNDMRKQFKQVRDNIHSLDLVNMFWEYCQAPRPGEVYNAGGGRFSNCSMKEAISLCNKRTGKTMDVVYSENNRISDHIWYISDTRKFQMHYPTWKQRYDLPRILDEIFESMSARVHVSSRR
jgi:CDP-paratose 2-epimerase